MGRERFLVTGALGCLGAWVAKELHDEGAEVVGFDVGDDARRLAEIMGPAAAASVALLRGDVTSKADLGRALDEHEITNVLHLAALQIPFCRADPIRGALVNVVGTVNVLECVRERRDRITAPVVYASSAALFGATDRERAARDERADARPSTHYGVYKQANEGNARIYWQDARVASLALRPYNVFGPARDQGITAEPTHAMKAAASGRAYHIPYGGRVVFNYTADVARALVAMSRSGYEGADAFNMPGSSCHMSEVVAAVEEAAPDARGMVTFEDESLPLPSDLAVGGLERAIGSVTVTPLVQAVRETVEHFREQAARQTSQVS